MKPGKYDLELYRGDTEEWHFALYTKDELGVKNPIDLTDAVANAELRDKSGGSIVSVFDCRITLPNFIDMIIPDDFWDTAPSKKGVWDLEITWPGPIVRTPLAGVASITADVTGSPIVVPEIQLNVVRETA